MPNESAFAAESSAASRNIFLILVELLHEKELKLIVVPRQLWLLVLVWLSLSSPDEGDVASAGVSEYRPVCASLSVSGSNVSFCVCVRVRATPSHCCRAIRTSCSHSMSVQD